MMENLQGQRRKPFIFIVYKTFEQSVADKLQKLLEAWGCDTFQSGQRGRDGDSFRKELRTHLRGSDLVILLISREFRWSAYCQAEAGTAMALNKPCIAVMVPPVVNEEEVSVIAPVLGGIQYLDAADSEFISNLHDAVAERLTRTRECLNELTSSLISLQVAEGVANLAVMPEATDKLCNEMKESLKQVENRYRMCQPERTLSSTWPTLGDEGCQESVIGNLMDQLKSTHTEVKVTLVGVSLKFSLKLITRALERLALESSKQPPPKKRLTVTVVHMDDQAHILNALHDERDLLAIRETFVRGWMDTRERWKELCGSTIHLLDSELYRIDYIPPRVGILLEATTVEAPSKDWRLLYAGRCAIRSVVPDGTAFNLDVGENEYHFYSKGGGIPTSRIDYLMIEEFKASFRAYKAIEHNVGIAPIWGSGPWVERMRLVIERLSEPTDITFISGTAKVFQPLIIGALVKKMRVTCYVCDSDTPARRVIDVHERLTRELGDTARKVEQRRYRHPATFRGVVIRDHLIGLQSYINAEERIYMGRGDTQVNMERVNKMPLCFIISRCFPRFEALQDHMLTFAQGDPLAAERIEF